MRHIMASLLYPELAAQACNHQQLEEWGEREAYTQQLSMLDHIHQIEENDNRARAMGTD